MDTEITKVSKKPRYHTKYDHWTDGTRTNYKFVAKLFDSLEGLPFTNKAAYHLYEQFNAERPTYPYKAQRGEVLFRPIRMNPFMQMNVRTQLCKLEHIGVLTRRSPGHYRWNPQYARLSTESFMIILHERNSNHDRVALQLVKEYSPFY